MKKFLIAMGGTAAGVLLAVFVIMGFVAHSCSNAAKESNPERPAAETPTVRLGDNFEVGGVSVSDTKARIKSDLGSDGFMDTRAKGVYVVITAHVTNNGNDAAGLDSMFQELHIGAKEYTANPFANIGTSSRMRTSVYLEPGFSEDVTFVFDVPVTSVNIGPDAASFTERTVLVVSGGAFDPGPEKVNVVLQGHASAG